MKRCIVNDCKSSMLVYTVVGRKRKMMCAECGNEVDLDIDDMLDRWARWTMTVQTKGLGGGGSSLGAAMVKMATHPCLVCKDNGRIDPNCDYCHGKGVVRMDKNDGRAIPGFISADATGPHDTYPVTDPDCEVIEQCWKTMDSKLSSVMWIEYTTRGLQFVKAVRLGISLRTYQRRLGEVRTFVAHALEMS